MKNGVKERAAECYASTLKHLMEERDISVAMLAKRLGLASRTGIYRIIGAACRYQTVENFHRSLVQNRSRLRFRDEDYALLTQALQVYRGSGEERSIGHDFWNLIFPPAPPVPPRASNCIDATRSEWIGKELADVLNALTESTELTLYIINSTYPVVLSALRQMCGMRNLSLRVVHLLIGKRSVFEEINLFLQIVPLGGNDRYCCWQLSVQAPVGATENSIVIHRTDISGERTVEQINFVSPEKFFYCAGVPDHDGQLSLFSSRYHACLCEGAATWAGNSRLSVEEKILAYYTECAHYEQDWSQILVRPDLDLSQIPTNYLIDLIERGKKQLSKGQTIVYQKLLDVHRQQYANFTSGKHGYVFLLSAAGIELFLRTGKLSDHLPGLLPFSLEERVSIVETFISSVEQNHGIVVRMLRENSGYSGIRLRCFDEEMLWISGACQGEMYPYDIYKLEDREIIHLLRHTLLQERMNEYTYSTETSCSMLRQIIAQICAENDCHTKL